MGLNMHIWQNLEQIRTEKQIPVFQMCNILAIADEYEYHKITHGQTSLTTYQKIMLVICTQTGLD